MCLKPFRSGVAEYGCGQCLPCRINRRRIWAARIMLESLTHEQSWFVTLTYAPEHLPAGGNLVPRHGQLFLKRVRRRADGRIRFFLVGEYGERTLRPHYHAMLFGLRDHTLVASEWPHGHVHVGSVTIQSAEYCCGYVSKKWTAKDIPELEGRHPEFARMSLRPGIGAPAVGSLARSLMTRPGASGLTVLGDVPLEFRVGGKKHPLSRYLRQLLRLGVGWNSEKTPEPVNELWQRKLQEELAMPGGRELRERKRDVERDRARWKREFIKVKGVF